MLNFIFKVIDSTLFIPKPDDSYIKELTRIRQEVDTLKQNAALNVPINSPIKITNGLHGINKTQWQCFVVRVIIKHLSLNFNNS